MTDRSSPRVARRLRLGMVGGGQGAFIGAVHRIAARLDDRYELVAGALSSDGPRARMSAAELHIQADRSYPDFAAMAQHEAARDDGIDVVAIVTPNHLHHAAASAFLNAGIHVICEKPMTRTIEEAQALVAMTERCGCLFALTHNYTGYPMVRQAREMAAAGELGAIRVVQVEYPQDWLTNAIDADGHKQAEWRTDPSRSGMAGCVGDIGTHAFNLAEFITGLVCTEVAADLTSFVDGRRLDDNAHLLLRFDGGARGMLWSSQVAPGNQNGLRIRVYGELAGIEWRQEHPDQLHVTRFGQASQIISRGGAGIGAAAAYATRIPGGHPEGYLEGFAQLYRDVAEQITALLENREPDPAALSVPTVRDGLRGMAFIAAAVESSGRNGMWTKIGKFACSTAG